MTEGAGIERLRAFLRARIVEEAERFYGVRDAEWIDHVTEAWLDDRANSEGRFRAIERFLGGAISPSTRILDMASGCGTFGFYGLLHGLDVWGIDPEEWKQEVVRMKVEA